MRLLVAFTTAALLTMTACGPEAAAPPAPPEPTVVETTPPETTPPETTPAETAEPSPTTSTPSAEPTETATDSGLAPLGPTGDPIIDAEDLPEAIGDYLLNRGDYVNYILHGEIGSEQTVHMNARGPLPDGATARDYAEVMFTDTVEIVDGQGFCGISDIPYCVFDTNRYGFIQISSFGQPMEDVQMVAEAVLPVLVAA